MLDERMPIRKRRQGHGHGARIERGRTAILAAAALASASTLVALTAGGCASPIALDRAVMGYDTTTADSVSKQLLLNIAHARHNQPLHFTAVSSIAATYRFAVSAGVGPAPTGDRGALLLSLIGGTAEENKPSLGVLKSPDGIEMTERGGRTPTAPGCCGTTFAPSGTPWRSGCCRGP